MSSITDMVCVILIITMISGVLIFFSKYCKRRGYLTPRGRQRMRTFGAFLGIIDACYIATAIYLILFHH